MSQYTDFISRLSVEKLALLRLRLGLSPAKETYSHRLEAFVQFKQHGSAQSHDLKDHLAALLPDYMQPHKIHMVDEFPRLPNGKLDCGALSRCVLPLVKEKKSPIKPGKTLQQLTQIWSDVLNTSPINPQDNFFELGGDSILSIYVVSQSNQAGLTLTPNDLFQHPILVELASVIETRQHKEDKPAQQKAGEFPLTPIQHWFFEQKLREPQQWNQNRLLAIREHTHTDALAKAINKLVSHHQVLRLCFPIINDKRVQQIGTQGKSELNVAPITNLDGQALDARVADIASQNQRKLQLSQGPLILFTLLKTPVAHPDLLLITSHHLLVDAISWQILEQNLTTLYDQAKANLPLSLIQSAASYLDWVDYLPNLAKRSKPETNFWAAQTTPHSNDIPKDWQRIKTPREGDAKIVKQRISEPRSKTLLTQVHENYHTTPLDFLLTALCQTCCYWAEKEELCIGMEGHGRFDPSGQFDLSRVCGWFTSYYPLLLHYHKEPGIALKAVKEKVRSVPNSGLGYGLLKYLSAETEIRHRLQCQSAPQILFNFMGNIEGSQIKGGSFTPLAIEPENQRHPENSRHQCIELNVLMEQGSFSFYWRYDPHIHTWKTISQLADAYVNRLEDLIDHCLNCSKPEYTPTDFPAAGLEQTDLDAFIQRLQDSQHHCEGEDNDQ